MERDLTKGKIFPLLFSFLLPVVLGLLLQQIYSLVDTAIVGRTLGVNALGGVGSTGSLQFLVIGFCNGLCSGFALPVAQAFGAGDRPQLRKYVTNSVALAALISAVIIGIVLPFTDDLLLIMETPEEQYFYAYSYIFIIFAGIPATMLYNLTAGIIRSLGDSKTPVYFLAISSVLNIFGDLFTIRVLHMGVAGAAWATILSQLISGLLCLLYMRRKYPVLRMESGDWRLQKTACSYLLSNGVPMGLQFSITAIGGVVVQSAVNQLGAIYVSANTTAHKINQFLMVPYMGQLTSSATFTGQNLGAKEYDRIKQGFFLNLLIGLIYWAAELLLLFGIGKRVFLLFLNSEELALIQDPAWIMLLIQTVGFFLLVPVNVARPAIQGMSYSKLALIAGVLEMAARILIALWGIPNFGYAAIGWAPVTAWIFADCFLIPAFFLCLRRERRKGEVPG